MKANEIKELITQELIERASTERDNLMHLKLNHAVSPLDNPLRITNARRAVARFETELRQRGIK